MSSVNRQLKEYLGPACDLGLSSIETQAIADDKFTFDSTKSYAILLGMKFHLAVDIGGAQMRAARYSSERLTPVKLEQIPNSLS